MSFSFEQIPYVVWGSGDTEYGDKDAKNKAIAFIKETNAVFINDSRIRDYEDHFKCKILGTKNLPKLYRFGFVAHAVPTDIAIRMLKDFKMGFFDNFMLRDYDMCHPDIKNKMYTENVTNEHLVLDFDSLIYRIGYRTDHCYD